MLPGARPPGTDQSRGEERRRSGGGGKVLHCAEGMKGERIDGDGEDWEEQQRGRGRETETEGQVRVILAGSGPL